jgi:glycosyltransferase involved in cell wall biosynthesis
VKILTIIHSYEPGGVEKVALRMAAYWSTAGHYAPVLVGRPDGASKSQVPKGAHLLLPERPFINPRPFETLWMICILAKYLRIERPDIFFCPGNSYTIVAVLMKLILGRDCPLVVAKISNDLHRKDFSPPVRWLYRIWLRIQGKMLDRLVGMAEPMRHEISKLMAVPEEKIWIIPDPALSENQIDRLSAPRKPSPKQQVGRKFVAIGRLAKQKNYPLMLRAFAAGAKAQDELSILGEGAERSRLEQLIKDLMLEQRVNLVGHVDDVASWLAHSDVFCMSSDYEGVPAALLEALASGIPIIATDCSVSMRDLLDGGTFGRLIPTGNLAELAAAIAAETASQQPVEARQAMARHHTLEKSAELYLLHMQEDLASRKKNHNSNAGFRAEPLDEKICSVSTFDGR